ncbi:non-ribosomal peptide synthetase, partial [Cellvibrio mixtus]|uniref:non-ribosomal peptide synthetase n=1 Tax=Cellvibrio mixtus TaxID=39650 RepID=UPI002286B71F
MQDEGVTVLNQTPSAFSAVITEDGNAARALSLRYIIFGGEALQLAMLSPWFERHGDQAPRLINMYGITETTVHVTHRHITRALVAESAGRSIIGRPLADLKLLVLNACQGLVPVGVEGELYVGGDGVTRGYLNQPALTEQRFVSLPEYGEGRFYRTGDLVRSLATGDLEYLGRLDEQVKIRGFRIELGEIEATLVAQGEVREALVLAKTAVAGEKYLVAYVLSRGAEASDSSSTELIERLRAYLRAHLPEHMVPPAFVVLAQWPLTANGKVDRKALPEADMGLQQGSYVAPGTETEQLLAEVWQEVLGIERVGVTDNFFHLGGHSL